MITPQQKAHFDDFGFLVLRNTFSPEEVDAIYRECDGLWEQDRGGGPPTGENQGISDIVEIGEVLTRMVADDRLFGAVEGLLGPGFVWNGSGGSLQFTTTETHWHSDRPVEPDSTTFSCNLYLSTLRAETGAFRLIAGSHKSPLYDTLLPLSEQGDETTLDVYGLDWTDIPGHVVDCDPGDIVFFDQRIYHGVFGMLPDRRYLKLRFVGKPETDEQIASFMRYDDRGSIYEPQPAFLDSDNPNIRAMVDPLLELRARTEADRERFDALGARETGLERMLRALDVRAEDLPASSDWQHHVANTLTTKYQGMM